MAEAKVDHELIRELAKLLDETGLTEIEIERDNTRVRVARQVYAAHVIGGAVPPSASAPGLSSPPTLWMTCIR